MARRDRTRMRGREKFGTVSLSSSKRFPLSSGDKGVDPLRHLLLAEQDFPPDPWPLDSGGDHHDGYRSRNSSRGPCGCARGNNNVNFEPYEFSSDGSIPFRLTLPISGLNYNVLTFNVAKIAKALSECLVAARIRIGSPCGQAAYTRNFCLLASAGKAVASKKVISSQIGIFAIMNFLSCCCLCFVPDAFFTESPCPPGTAPTEEWSRRAASLH